MATGMNALRRRGYEERPKPIRVIEFEVLGFKNYQSLEKVLKEHDVKWWSYDGVMYTWDERIHDIYKAWLRGEIE